MSNAETLIHAFMTSRLDYCNALLGGCSARLINKLQMVQNTAARVLTRIPRISKSTAGGRSFSYLARDDLYSPERPLDEPQRQTPSEDLVS